VLRGGVNCECGAYYVGWRGGIWVDKRSEEMGSKNGTGWIKGEKIWKAVWKF
jgi:hypothetical protein